MPLPKEALKTTPIPHQQFYGWAYPMGGASRWAARHAAVLRAVFFCRRSALPATSSALRPQPQPVAFCRCPLDGASRLAARYAAVLFRRRSASQAPGFALRPQPPSVAFCRYPLQGYPRVGITFACRRAAAPRRPVCSNLDRAPVGAGFHASDSA